MPCNHMEGITVIPNLSLSLSLTVLFFFFFFFPVLSSNKGFHKDEFKVQVDCCGKLTIRGKRPLGDGNYMRLEQVFDVPKDSRIDKIRGKFEEARLSLFMPKKVVTEKEAPQRAVSCQKGQTEEEKTPEEKPPVGDEKEEAPTQQEPTAKQKVSDRGKAVAWKVGIEEHMEGWLDYGLIDGLLETISKNKKDIAIAAAAFSIGFYVSGKLRSSGR